MKHFDGIANENNKIHKKHQNWPNIQVTLKNAITGGSGSQRFHLIFKRCE